MACYLYVKDYSSETTLMDLIMYFQSKESGGGDIDDEFCTLENKIATIAFDDDKDLKHVLSKDHNLKGSKLTISNKPFKQKPKAAPRKSKKPQENKAPPNVDNNKPIIGEIKTVIVTGISPDTTADTLLLFFQNKRRSGGGDIDNIQRVEPQVAHIIFDSAEVAKHVLEKGNLEIDGFLLALKANKPEVTFPKDKKKLFIENLDPKTSKDSLTNYVEVITGLDVKDIVFGIDKNAMVTLDDEPDMKNVTEKTKTKLLEGAELKITNPPVCHSVLMIGFSKMTTKDAIELKFENTKHGGSDILDVVYEQEQGKAVVSFLDPNVIQGITSKEHFLNGAKITASPYYPFLDERVIDMPRNIKKVIQVSQDVMDYVSNRCDKEFRQEFGFDIATTKYDEEKKDLTFPTTLPTGELIEKRIEEIESYFNQFSVEELDVPKNLFVNSKDEVEETLAETMKSFINVAHAAIEDEKRCIVITGKKEKLPKVVKVLQKELNELEKRKELLTTQLSLQQRKLMLFIALGFEERFESESDIEVKIDPQNGVLTLKGSKQLVESAKVQVLEEYSKITDERIDLSESQEDYLMSGGLQKINDDLKKRKVNALVCLDKSNPRKAIVELLSPEKFDKVKEYLSEQMFEESFAVEEESVDLLKSEKWSVFRDTLQRNYAIKIYTIGHLEVNIWLTGEKHLVKQAREKLEHFIKINTIISESITVDQTIAGHLSRFCNNKMKEIEDTLNSHMVKFGREEASLTVQGTKEGVKIATAKLQDTIDDLAYRMIPIDKPGMQKYLESVAGKASLVGIESKHQCTINLTTEVTQRSTKISSVVNPRTSNSSTMMLCSYETPERILFKVYQADITTHACDVIVNAANSELQHIGGLARMIVNQGGEVIQNDCDEYIRKNRTLSPGECYTGIPGKLPCKHIIHTVAPRWDNNNQFRDRRYLEFACENTLEAAKTHSSIALPAIGSGIYQVPKDVCADVMVEVAVKFSSKNGRNAALKEIRFVNNDSTTATSFLKEFRRRFGDKPTFSESFSKRGSRRFIQDEARGERRKAEFGEMTSGKSEGRSSQENGDRITTNTNATMSIVVGDLSTHQADVLVNTTSENLKLDSNPCSRALSNEAGPVLQQKCNQVGKLNVGQVVFTEGGNLLCKQVCHVICTQWNNGEGEKVLRSIVQNCLTKSQSLGMKSIAFPAIGTGVLGFPHHITAKICFEESKEFGKKNPTTCLKDIRFVVYHQDQASIKAFKDELRQQPEWKETASEVGSRRDRRKPITESSSKEKGEVMASTMESSDPRAPLQTPIITEEDGEILVSVQGKIKIQVLKGDITQENTDVVAHLSNPDMSMEGGVAKALIKNGGKEIARESWKKKPVKTYNTVLTEAGSLQAKYIAHMAGPDRPKPDDIEKCITNCLKEITDRNCSTISFPAIATGQLNMPVEKSAKAMLTAIVRFLQTSPDSLKTVRIVIFENEIFKKFSKAVKKLFEPENEQSPGIWSVIWDTVTSFWKSGSGSTGAKENDGLQKSELFLEIFAEKYETLAKVADHIGMIMDEQMKKESIEDEFITNLSENYVSRIIKIGKENNVEVTIQKPVNRIIVHGHTEDVSKVIIEIKSILNEGKFAEQEKENAEMVSQGVQWFWEDTDGSQVKYDVSFNSKIEKAHLKKKKSVTFSFEEGKCEIDFKNMQETNHTTKVKTNVFRQAKADISVPDYWDPQPKDAKGKEAPLHMVSLDSQNPNHNKEYKNISDGFLQTANTNTIQKIERIQNPSLFKLYALKKQSMDEQGGSNEKFLYHGTVAKNVPDINLNGLNRSYKGVNGTAFGHGIYFATNASMSAGYASADAAGNRNMYVARVATGQCTLGNANMIVPPKKAGNVNYDSVVNNATTPTIYVMFYDNQYYPEYLITFK